MKHQHHALTAQHSSSFVYWNFVSCTISIACFYRWFEPSLFWTSGSLPEPLWLVCLCSLPTCCWPAHWLLKLGFVLLHLPTVSTFWSHSKNVTVINQDFWGQHFFPKMQGQGQRKRCQRNPEIFSGCDRNKIRQPSHLAPWPYSNILLLLFTVLIWLIYKLI